MSTYTNYGDASKGYDKTRQPIGLEIILGCLVHGLRRLDHAVILDAGCGTGSYSLALSDYVAEIDAVDRSEAMLSEARRKLRVQHEQGRVRFHEARIDSLPFADATFDGVMINQVLHHLEAVPTTGYAAHFQALNEIARVAKPGGLLVIQTSSRAQLRDSFWFYSLVPRAAQEITGRFAPIADLVAMLRKCGFRYSNRVVPSEAVLQGEAYFDPRGPLDDDWRAGDSFWALTTPEERAAVGERINAMETQGTLHDYLARHDSRRQEIGQVTFLSFTKEPPL